MTCSIEYLDIDVDDQVEARERETLVDVLVEFEWQWAERARFSVDRATSALGLSYTDLYRALNRLARSGVVHVDSRWRLGARQEAA